MRRAKRRGVRIVLSELPKWTIAIGTLTTIQRDLGKQLPFMRSVLVPRRSRPFRSDLRTVLSGPHPAAPHLGFRQTLFDRWTKTKKFGLATMVMQTLQEKHSLT